MYSKMFRSTFLGGGDLSVLGPARPIPAKKSQSPIPSPTPIKEPDVIPNCKHGRLFDDVGTHDMDLLPHPGILPHPAITDPAEAIW